MTRGFWKFVRASVLMFVRDRQAAFWSFAFPVFFMLLLGAAFGNTGKVAFDIGVVNQDVDAGGLPSNMSVRFTDSVDGVKSVTVHRYTDEDRARARLKSGDLDVVVVIPRGFQARLAVPSANQTPQAPLNVSILYDRNDPARSSAAVSIVQQVLGGFVEATRTTPPPLAVQQEGVSAANLRYIDFLAPGIICMAIMTNSIFGLTLFIASAREKGILKRLRATPISPAYLIGARILVNLMVVGMQAAIIITIAVLGFGVQIVGSVLLVSLITILGALVFITLGFAIASFAKSVETAETIANAVAMPMMFLGNIFIPIKDMPPFVQVISNVMPVTYFADALRQVMLHGAGIGDVAYDLGVLLITGVVVFGLAAKFFRWE